jgi:hypothetical protein
MRALYGWLVGLVHRAKSASARMRARRRAKHTKEVPPA